MVSDVDKIPHMYVLAVSGLLSPDCVANDEHGVVFDALVVVALMQGSGSSYEIGEVLLGKQVGVSE